MPDDPTVDWFNDVERPLHEFVTQCPDFARLVAEQAAFIEAVAKAERVEVGEVVTSTPRFLRTGGVYLEARIAGRFSPDRIDDHEHRHVDL